MELFEFLCYRDVDVVKNSFIFIYCLHGSDVITHFDHYINIIGLKRTESKKKCYIKYEEEECH